MKKINHLFCIVYMAYDFIVTKLIKFEWSEESIGPTIMLFLNVENNMIRKLMLNNETLLNNWA